MAYIPQTNWHTFKSTAAYLVKEESEARIKCIPFDEIPVKSPDASQMDFCAWVLGKGLLSWKIRITAIVKNHGAIRYKQVTTKSVATCR